MSLRIVRIPSGAARRRRRQGEEERQRDFPFTVAVTDAADRSAEADLSIRLLVARELPLIVVVTDAEDRSSSAELGMTFLG